MPSAFSHAIVATAIGKVVQPKQVPWWYWALGAAMSAVPDVDVIAMTNGGLGVALFSPFSNARFFFPFRPIKVSPIGVGRFFSAKGLAVVQSEVMWLWLPSAAIFAVLTLLRAVRNSGGPRSVTS